MKKIELTPQQQEYIDSKIVSGFYQSAEEVIGEALRLLKLQDAAFAKEPKLGVAVKSVLEHKSEGAQTNGRNGAGVKSYLHDDPEHEQPSAPIIKSLVFSRKGGFVDFTKDS